MGKCKSMHQRFCWTCGVHSFGRFESEGAKKVVVNGPCPAIRLPAELPSNSDGCPTIRPTD